MGELLYSVLRYEPSIVSGEKINLGVVFHYPEEDFRDFFHVSKWNRIAAFDDTLNIPLLKDLMLDIKEEIGTQIDNPQFNLGKFCAAYNSKLYFDKCITFSNIDRENLSSQIDEIIRIYFQFEFDETKRPSNDDQKRFLKRILSANHIEYQRNKPEIGCFGDTITYDYTFGNYGVIFINLNSKKIDNKTMNKVKAWAWNAQNSRDELKLIVLYDLEDESRTNVKPALDILRASAYGIINIHDGFSDVTPLIEKISS